MDIQICIFSGNGGNPSVEGNENTYTGDTIARQGAYKSTLGENGYPISVNGKDLTEVFNENDIENSKKVYKNLNHLFKKENGYYVYDSSKNYAYYDISQGNNGSFKVYNDTYDIYQITNMPGLNNSGNKTKVGFFPFDKYDPTKVDVGPSDYLAEQNVQGYNHQFGLTLESDFYYTVDGKVDNRDMIFSFSGDDDAILFVDGVLVLDLGGLHNPMGGTINFTTGDVIVNGDVVAVQGQENNINGKTNTIDNIFSKAGKTFDKTTNSKHTLKFYYLERGGCYSNASITTNVFDLANPGSIDIPVEKVWDDITENNHKNDEIEVEIYSDDTLVENKKIILNSANNWKGKFEDLPRYKVDEYGNATLIEYTIKEKDFPDYVPYYKSGMTENVVDDIYWVKVRNFEDGETYIISGYNWSENNGNTGISNSGNNIGGSSIELNRTSETDESGNTIYRASPTEAQMWIAHNNGNDHQWQFENNGKYMALYGTADNNESNFGIGIIDKNKTKDEETGRYYNNTFWFDYDSSKLMGTVYFEQGESSLYWLYLNNGVTPAAATNYNWSGTFDIFKKVETKKEIFNENYQKIDNKREEKGNLTINKTVINSKDLSGKTYKFNIKLSNNTLTGRYGDLMFKNGEANFLLKSGESKSVTSLPAGITYSIVEIDENTDEVLTKTREVGTITAGATIDSVFKQEGKEEVKKENENNVKSAPTDAVNNNGGNNSSSAPSTSSVSGQTKKYNTPNTGDTNYRMHLIITLIIASYLLFEVRKCKVCEARISKVRKKTRVASISKVTIKQNGRKRHKRI